MSTETSETPERESAFHSTTLRNGEIFEYFDEELAVKQLMARGIMDVFFPKLSRTADDEKDVRSLALGVNTNDMFYFAVSDMQLIESEDELKALYTEFERDPEFGYVVWLSRKEGIQPCARCYINPMKRAGAWTEEMEALPKGPQS